MRIRLPLSIHQLVEYLLAVADRHPEHQRGEGGHVHGRHRRPPLRTGGDDRRLDGCAPLDTAAAAPRARRRRDRGARRRADRVREHRTAGLGVVLPRRGRPRLAELAHAVEPRLGRAAADERAPERTSDPEPPRRRPRRSANRRATSARPSTGRRAARRVLPAASTGAPGPSGPTAASRPTPRRSLRASPGGGTVDAGGLNPPAPSGAYRFESCSGHALFAAASGFPRRPRPDSRVVSS